MSAIVAPELVNPAGMATADQANAEAAGTGDKKLSSREWKNLMRLYFTVRRPTVDGCGHKIDTENGPKNNCETCWFAYFNNHSEMVQAIDQAMRTEGPEVVIALRGVKFVKMFRKFMSTVAQWIKEGKIKGTGEQTTDRSGT